MIFNFLEFLNEVKKQKLEFFKNEDISNKFTCSIEIELETEDASEQIDDYSEDFIDGIIEKIKNSVIKELLRIDNFEFSDLISDFIDNILQEVKYEYDDYDYLFDKLLNDNKYKEKNYNKLIINLIRPQVLTYFFSDNYEYLENMIKDHLPNFYKKYSLDLKFELDNTLDKGIEISNKKYFNSINELIDLVNSFYEDFNNQEYWKFTDKTGIHINIGTKDKKEFNYIKGLLFLNDSGDNPFVFRNMMWRKNSEFCGSLLNELSKKEDILKKALNNINNINQTETIINSELEFILKDIGYKKFGVNLTPIKRFNYVEFRYPGGDIDKNTLIDKILYFTYIIYLMTEKDEDVREYHKKLFKFLNNS
jgi:hypothetical protein